MCQDIASNLIAAFHTEFLLKARLYAHSWGNQVSIHMSIITRHHTLPPILGWQCIPTVASQGLVLQLHKATYDRKSVMLGLCKPTATPTVRLPLCAISRAAQCSRLPIGVPKLHSLRLLFLNRLIPGSLRSESDFSLTLVHLSEPATAMPRIHVSGPADGAAAKFPREFGLLKSLDKDGLDEEVGRPPSLAGLVISLSQSTVCGNLHSIGN